MLTHVAEANLQCELVIETSLCNSICVSCCSYITEFPRLWCKWQTGMHILPNASYRVGNLIRLSSPTTDISLTLQVFWSKGDFSSTAWKACQNTYAYPECLSSAAASQNYVKRGIRNPPLLPANAAWKTLRNCRLRNSYFPFLVFTAAPSLYSQAPCLYIACFSSPVLLLTEPSVSSYILPDPRKFLRALVTSQSKNSLNLLDIRFRTLESKRKSQEMYFIENIYHVEN